MSEPTRLLWGAPGGVLAGHAVDDVTRRNLTAHCQQVPQHAMRQVAIIPELTEEVVNALTEVERMREAMGEKRMDHDARRQALRRASAWAALVLQQESAFLSTYFAPGDPESEVFAPAVSLALTTSVNHRRVTRLDKLRQAWQALPHLPEAEQHIELLSAASTRLFRAITEATATENEPQPLAEARQRFDRGYVMLRDTVRALRVMTTEGLVQCFPDLSPAWRRTDLQR